MRVAAIQMRSGLTPEGNLPVLESLVRDAAAKGATYIQTPEMTGAMQRDRIEFVKNLRSENDDLIVASASRLASELKVTLHIGSTAILRADGKVANRAFVFGQDGALVATYDKIHMFDVDLPNGESWRESATYTGGNEAVMVQIDAAKIGLAVCYDLRFAELFRNYGANGAHILTLPAAFTQQTGEAHWHVLLRARAIETGSFVVAAAQGGTHADGRQTFGHSLIIDPWGKILAEKADSEPGIIFADLDLEMVEATRARIPNLKNRRDIVLRKQTPIAAE
ncbi:MAG: carbon-nitrogen hydrolase family protein [Notoacmeibacter sp.]